MTNKKQNREPTDEQQTGAIDRPRVVCVGCGKAVSGKEVRPGDRCHDCKKHFVQATPEKLACDRCGDKDASSVLNSEYNRLCDDCIDFENRQYPACPECGRMVTEITGGGLLAYCWWCNDRQERVGD